MTRCGHVAIGGSGDFVCDLPRGHRGYHAQRTKLRGASGLYTSTTNWGDDGLAPHATKYPENGTYLKRERDLLNDDDGSGVVE